MTRPNRRFMRPNAKYDLATIGGRVRRARILQGISGREMADLLGTSEAQVSRIETQGRAWTDARLAAIQGLLCVSGDYLLGLLPTIEPDHAAWSLCCPGNAAKIVKQARECTDSPQGKRYTHNVFCTGCRKNYTNYTTPDDAWHNYVIAQRKEG